MTYKRPHFVREESWRYKRVKESWRSPLGETSRVRRSKEGWRPVVKIGYARPKDARARHPSGLTEVMVWRPQDLTGLDPKTQAVRIAHTVGENKRVQIIDQAKKATIRVLNPGVKKEPEAVPQVAPEPAEPTAEATAEPTVEPSVETAPEEPATQPEEPAKETETPKTEEPKTHAKKPRKTKSSKKKGDKD